MRWPAISGQLEGLQAVSVEALREREADAGAAFCPPALPASEAQREELCQPPPAGGSTSRFPEYRNRDRGIASRFGPRPERLQQ